MLFAFSAGGQLCIVAYAIEKGVQSNEYKIFQNQNHRHNHAFLYDAYVFCL